MRSARIMNDSFITCGYDFQQEVSNKQVKIKTNNKNTNRNSQFIFDSQFHFNILIVQTNYDITELQFCYFVSSVARFFVSFSFLLCVYLLCALLFLAMIIVDVVC